MTAIEFNTQISQLYGTLELFTSKFTRDKEDSEDLIQETILKALANRDKFSANTNLKGWLYTIMRNTFINKYRKQRFQNTYHDDTENQFHLNKVDNYTFSNPGSNYEYKELMQRVENLPAQYGDPFLMYFNGYKYQEIADELNIPIGTVKNRIFQARKMMQAA